MTWMEAVAAMREGHNVRRAGFANESYSMHFDDDANLVNMDDELVVGNYYDYVATDWEVCE